MPFFRTPGPTRGQLVYYAHVPKCGGSSIASYLKERFGTLAFHDNQYLTPPEPQRWTKSSPQHVDRATLDRLVPIEFFDHIFAIVRHPLARAISTYHFQLELERSIPENTRFGDWLKSLADADPNDPFRYDNHTRPMTDIVPEGAAVFYLEHGLDGLIPWFDQLTGTQDGPRAIVPENKRGDHVKKGAPKGRVSPSDSDLALLAEIYKADFDRFDYVVDQKTPTVDAPDIDAAFFAERDRALKAAQAPVARLRRKIRRRLEKL